MKTRGSRLKYVIESKGFKVGTFCSKYGLDYSYLHKVTHNKLPLSIKTLDQIKEFIPDLDSEWVLYDNKLHDIEKNYHEVLRNNSEEPSAEYTITDPFEKMFLEYLEKPKSQAIMKKQIKEIIAQLDLGGGTPHTISHGEANSELMQRIEDNLKEKEKGTGEG